MGFAVPPTAFSVGSAWAESRFIEAQRVTSSSSWSLPLPQLHTDPSLSFKYGQGLPTSELLGKADVVSLKLHCSLVVKGVGGLGALNFYTLHGKLLKIHNCNKTP